MLRSAIAYSPSPSIRAQERPEFDTRILLRALLVGGDLLISYAALCAAFLLRFKTPLADLGTTTADLGFIDYQPPILLGAVIMLAALSLTRAHTLTALASASNSTLAIIKASAIWASLFLGISLAFKLEPSISRLFVLVGAVVTGSALVAWRLALSRFVRRPKLLSKLAQSAIVIGEGEHVERLQTAAETQNHFPYQIRAVIAVEREAILDAIRKHAPAVLILSDHSISRETFEFVREACERHFVKLKIIPSGFEIFLSNLRMEHLGGVPLLGHEDPRSNDLFNRVCKRVLDINGATFGLVLSLPLLLIAAGLIKLESPGPVIFRQVRSGANGRPFTMYKLRSMYAKEARDEERFTLPDDPRCTRFGRFMRRWNLDEIPQFFNVLLGDMSLVGPRPERPELIRQFEQEIPHYTPRHLVLPGMTGWAQINGLRGNTDLYARVRHDIYYIENWSIWFDIQIMLLTFLRRRNAY